MSYELNVISVGQKQPSSNDHSSSVFIQNEVTNADIQRYFRIWPVFSHIEGILYSIDLQVDEDRFSSFPICDSNFESSNVDDLLPNFIYDETNLTPLIIYPQYSQDVENVIKKLLIESPCKTILFLARYEGGDSEVFCGSFSIDDFLNRLRKHQVLFNVCYIVTDKVSKSTKHYTVDYETGTIKSSE